MFDRSINLGHSIAIDPEEVPVIASALGVLVSCPDFASSDEFGTLYASIQSKLSKITSYPAVVNFFDNEIAMIITAFKQTPESMKSPYHEIIDGFILKLPNTM